MTVLSLFDGMSCGRIALEKAGIPVDTYISSEVDKYAIQVADKNYTQDSYFRMGDVCGVKAEYLPPIDLLIGGSPCQSFSFAGKRKGMSTKCDLEILSLEHYLQLRESGFEFQGQSYLFWEYMRILKETKPRYFLLENVVMSKKWEKILTDAIGVEPIMINSALVSAQNRKRLYWTNIPGVSQPMDKGEVIADILEDEVEDRFYMRQEISLKAIEQLNPDALNHVADINVNGHDILKRVYAVGGKAPTATTCSGGNMEVKVLLPCLVSKQGRELSQVGKEKATCLMARDYKGFGNQGTNGVIVASRGRYLEGVRQDHKMPVVGLTEQKYEPRTDGKTNCLTTVQKDNYLFKDYQVRKLTPLEYERLQTVPDGYTDCVSNSQRYKMLGNGWTVDVIAHIFRGLI